MKTTRNERGNAMVITLLLLVILTAIGIYAVSISTTEMDISLQWKAGTAVFNAAESGVYYGYDQIGSATGATFSIPTGGSVVNLPNGTFYSGTGTLTGMTLAPGNGGTFRLASYEVTSRGESGVFSAKRSVQAVVEFGPIPVGTMY